jgi:hypothetical protein
LDFDVFAHEDFFLERVAPSTCATAAAATSAGEGAEEVFEVDVLKAACALGATEPAKSTEASSAEWVSAWCSSARRSWIETSA